MSYTQNNISYDKKYDVLYFSIENNDNSYGDEIDDNIVLMKDIESNSITGITIMGFIKLYHNKPENIQQLNQYFNIDEVAKKCLLM
jgi:hypothetical protein